MEARQEGLPMPRPCPPQPLRHIWRRLGDPRGRRIFRAQWAVQVGERLPQAASVAAGGLVGLSLGLLLGPPSTYPHIASKSVACGPGAGACRLCSGRVLLGLRSFALLLLLLGAMMTLLKRRALPALIPPEQFPEGFCLGKYYGFAAQVMHHCVLAMCFIVTIVWRGSISLYHVATLAEPAYCTFDVMLLLCTGASFTHWEWTPLLVHHVISCACTHALMYGIPCSVYGNLLQLTFHSSSAVCLGIANALVTPSLGVGARGRLLLQLAALAFWTVTRVGLVLILGVCILLDAQQVLGPQRWRVTAELAAAAIGSCLFVVIKTPAITGALKEAIQEYQEALSPAAIETGAVEREPSFVMHEQVLSWGGRSC